MGWLRTEEPNQRINLLAQANKGKQTPRTTSNRGEFKSQMATNTPEKPNDKGVDA